MQYIKLNNGKTIKDEMLKEASQAALRAIGNVIPEELCCCEVCNIVLDYCKTEIKEKQIAL